MKRLVSLVLALILTASLSTMAMAVVGTPDDVPGVADVPSWGITVDDPIDGVGSFYVPGITYVFPLTSSGADLGKDFYDEFRTSVKVTEGKNYIEMCDIRKRSGEDGYALYVRPKQSSSYIDSKSATIEITVAEKKITTIASNNVKGKLKTTFTIDIGYNNSEFVNSSSHEVTMEAPIVEFSSELDRTTLLFGSAAEYDAKFDKKVQFNLSYSTAEDTSIVRKNPNATMTFIKFYSKPRFEINSEFRMSSYNAKYIYEVTDKGLVKLDVKKKGDFLCFNTLQLKSYVASDRELTSPTGTTTTSSSSSTGGGTTAPPTGGGTTLSESSALSTLNSALSSVGAGGTAYPTFNNVTSVTTDTLRAVNSAAVKAGKKANMIFDTVTDKRVTGRYYIDPSKAANLPSTLKTMIYTDSSFTRAVFEKHYNNNVAIASLEQKVSFGTPVSIAVKLDLSKLNTQTLKFYAYDTAKNSYLQFSPVYSIDTAGYLYFDTTLAGDIVITDKALVTK